MTAHSPTSTAPPALGGSRWHTFPAAGTTLTAREFFTATEPLLQGVIDAGALTAADDALLAEQIRATLALGTRETSLPLRIGPDSAPPARELGAQAEEIGRELASWATASFRRLLTDRIPLPAGPLVVRSHCYGHLLTPAAAERLLHRGGPVTMQLYNEWLHQIVLLRDALLPFTPWQDVPLRISPLGLRHLEEARDTFLTELLVRRVRHTSVVAFARRAVTGTDGPDGYGFDAPGGTALPAVLGLPPLTAPRYLLTWRPGPAPGAPVSYVAELPDYYAAPRTPVEELPATPAAAGPLTARVVPGPVTGATRTAAVEVTRADGTAARVDLGQALRGHRFARREDAAAPLPARTAELWTALRAPGLVWTGAGDTTVDATGQDPLVTLALLGRLYPENVTLRAAAHPAHSADDRAGRTAPDGGGPSRLLVLAGPPHTPTTAKKNGAES
ncbi:hypothetical protein AB0E75_25085 [Streptomyces griseoviridis]|uniref:Uncharacterized protein n=1 Tax=Streptomyces griseoviridis TaxID=45398 RepID=A0A918LIS7_STRGD|nr:hypothetical protein [Streptomyces niveoruber]GGS53722.1 hypothetical protein GCM10010238_49050 [Streptomyces niveoruber]